MGDAVFDDYGSYYDLFYKDKNFIGEAEYINNLLVDYGLKSAKLLEFGSGTGKHGRLLADMGHTIHGIERSEKMLALSRLTPRFTVELGDICAKKTGHLYDAVLSLFHVVSYQVRNAQLQAVFRNAAAHLEKGGLFIFDFWYTPAVYAQKPISRIKRAEDEQFEIIRVAEPTIHSDANCVEVAYDIHIRNKCDNSFKAIQEKHLMRHFSLPEIDIFAELSGFRRIRTEEFYTGATPSEDTWGVLVVLELC